MMFHCVMYMYIYLINQARGPYWGLGVRKRPRADILPVRSRASLVNKRFITRLKKAKTCKDTSAGSFGTMPGPILREYWTGNRAFWLADFSYWPSVCLSRVINVITTCTCTYILTCSLDNLWYFLLPISLHSCSIYFLSDWVLVFLADICEWNKSKTASSWSKVERQHSIWIWYPLSIHVHVILCRCILRVENVSFSQTQLYMVWFNKSL